MQIGAWGGHVVALHRHSRIVERRTGRKRDGAAHVSWGGKLCELLEQKQDWNQTAYHIFL
jgi:hypothetical protein